MKHLLFILSIPLLFVGCSKSDCDQVSIRFINNSGIDFEKFTFMESVYTNIGPSYESAYQCEEQVLGQDGYLHIDFYGLHEDNLYRSTLYLGLCGVGLYDVYEGTFDIEVNGYFISDHDGNAYLTYSVSKDD
jgi:hypothetical protein